MIPTLRTPGIQVLLVTWQAPIGTCETKTRNPTNFRIILRLANLRLLFFVFYSPIWNPGLSSPNERFVALISNWNLLIWLTQRMRLLLISVFRYSIRIKCKQEIKCLNFDGNHAWWHFSGARLSCYIMLWTRSWEMSPSTIFRSRMLISFAYIHLLISDGLMINNN